MDLKDRGIYQLPNGRELVARVTESEVLFYSLDPAEIGEYELNSDGRILLNGKVTAWDNRNLSETGQQLPPDMAEALARRALAYMPRRDN